MLLLMRWESAEGARPGHSRPTKLHKIKNLVYMEDHFLETDPSLFL